jgi:predicted DNA-binding protein (MmcQ/YjbR family)
MVKDDPALRRVRAVCLALPETSEAGSWGHPNFRAGKKTFAAFEWIAGRPSVAFRLNGVDVDLLLRRRNFFETPYGRRQWVSVWTDQRVNWRLVERLLLTSYRLVALKRMIAARDKASPRKGRAGGGVRARGAKK